MHLHFTSFRNENIKNEASSLLLNNVDYRDEMFSTVCVLKYEEITSIMSMIYVRYRVDKMNCVRTVKFTISLLYTRHVSHSKVEFLDFDRHILYQFGQ